MKKRILMIAFCFISVCLLGLTAGCNGKKTDSGQNTLNGSGDYLLLGNQCYTAQDYPCAEKNYRAALTNGRQNALAANNLARLYLRMGKNLSEAYELAGQAVAKAKSPEERREFQATRDLIGQRLETGDRYGRGAAEAAAVDRTPPPGQTMIYRPNRVQPKAAQPQVEVEVSRQKVYGYGPGPTAVESTSSSQTPLEPTVIYVEREVLPDYYYDRRPPGWHHPRPPHPGPPHPPPGPGVTPQPGPGVKPPPKGGMWPNSLSVPEPQPQPDPSLRPNPGGRPPHGKPVRPPKYQSGDGSGFSVSGSTDGSWSGQVYYGND